MSDDTDYNVAKEFVIKKGKPNEKRYDFADLSNSQLRKLCLQCNIKGAGSFSNWQALTSLASWATAGTIYQANNIANNPFTTATAKRLNTYMMRIVNVCFLSTMVQRFIDLNDRKKREDYERCSGGDPIKDFFLEASNMVNNTNLNSMLEKVAASKEGEDKYLHEWSLNGDLNLNDFDMQTHQTCQSKAYYLLKSRELAFVASKESGTHMKLTSGASAVLQSSSRGVLACLRYLHRQCITPILCACSTWVLMESLQTS
jgi:hypothetical protein